MPYWTKWSVLPLFLFAAALQAQPLQKTFSDWQITCNNLNSCEARSFPGDNGLAMTLERAAGNNAQAELRIDYGNRYSGELTGGALRDNLLLDGRRLQLDLKHWDVEPHHLLTHHAISIDEFLAQVMDADAIQLLYRADATVSLHGLKAALLLMDEVQGRVNGASAWIKRGDRAAWDVPPVPALPQVAPPPRPPLALTHEETSGLIDFGTWRVNSDSCSLNPQRREVSVSPLNDEKALLLVSCEMGAYNTIDLAFEVTRSQPYVSKSVTLTLPFAPPEQSSKQLELVNADFDAARGELLTYSKDRGLGDCGVATRWQYNGREFVLAEYAQESTCDAWHSSDQWPTLWVSNHSQPPATASVEMQP
ncbi:DUF1176 domain-containing protein [Erwinia aphidicola]|uniref:DUF1176 domain-containing protein n=1 Tax=Erwinia aphidicola TaxID=68334 RepID=UPI003016A4FB